MSFLWFKISKETKDTQSHKDTCPGKKANASISTLASQLKLGTPIPNELENAAREVIKFKLLSSKDKTIEFKSGGPRVSD